MRPCKFLGTDPAPRQSVPATQPVLSVPGYCRYGLTPEQLQEVDQQLEETRASLAPPLGPGSTGLAAGVQGAGHSTAGALVAVG